MFGGYFSKKNRAKRKALRIYRDLLESSWTYSGVPNSRRFFDFAGYWFLEAAVPADGVTTIQRSDARSSGVLLYDVDWMLKTPSHRVVENIFLLLD